jgi:hypothetical protein
LAIKPVADFCEFTAVPAVLKLAPDNPLYASGKNSATIIKSFPGRGDGGTTESLHVGKDKGGADFEAAPPR